MAHATYSKSALLSKRVMCLLERRLAKWSLHPCPFNFAVSAKPHDTNDRRGHTLTIGLPSDI